MLPPVIAGPYLEDLLAQPAALQGLVETLARSTSALDVITQLRATRFRRVVLTGMGSSLHALYPLHFRLHDAGIATHWLETSELLLGYRHLRAPDTLLVAVSQSGESAELVMLAREFPTFGHVVAVTNNPGSTVGRRARTIVPLMAGPEATVSCKTYLNTLAALHWLGAALVDTSTSAALAEISLVVPHVRRYLGALEEHVAALADSVVGLRSVFVTGRGVSLATAGTGGLILKESTRQPAEGMSCAAFRHGPLELTDEDVLVVIFAGDVRTAPLHRKLRDDVLRAGGNVAFASVTEPSAEVFRLPVVPDLLLPLVEILPVQMLSLALAARDGREPGRFERATKITTAD